jgi:hypothetical protein
MVLPTHIFYVVTFFSSSLAVPSGLEARMKGPARLGKTPSAFCTPNQKLSSCALGIGLKNPTSSWENALPTNLTAQIFSSGCEPLTNLFPLNDIPKNDALIWDFPPHGSLSIGPIDLPVYTVYDADDCASEVNCNALSPMQCPSWCSSDGCGSYDSFVCGLTAGGIQFQPSDSEGRRGHLYTSSLSSLYARTNNGSACNCGMGNCPGDYDFCCGCEFECVLGDLTPG